MLYAVNRSIGMKAMTKFCPLRFDDKGNLECTFRCAWYVFHKDLGQCVLIKLARVLEELII